MGIVRNVDVVKDTDIFVTLHPHTRLMVPEEILMEAATGVASPGAAVWKTRIPPKDFVFVPTILWKDSSNFTTDEFSKIFLLNKWKKLAESHSQLTSEYVKGERSIEGLRVLKRSYEENPRLGDALDVIEQMWEIKRDLGSARWGLRECEVQLGVLENYLGMSENIGGISSAVSGNGGNSIAVGGDYGGKGAAFVGGGNSGGFHEFKSANFAIPIACDYCMTTIWGVTKPGVTCEGNVCRVLGT
jgi:hypothetical protein